VATRQLGIIMNGVTGRMGLNQHLVRSIIAIRDQGGVEVGGPARDAVRLGQLLDLAGVAADQDRIGHHPVAVLERDPALRADRDDRADQVLVHPHAAGDAVHDDAETKGFHAKAPEATVSL